MVGAAFARMKRSLPYIGIARMLQQGVSEKRVSYIVQKAAEAAGRGCSDEEIERVIKKARFERMK